MEVRVNKFKSVYALGLAAAFASLSGCTVETDETDEASDPVYTETKVVLHGDAPAEVFQRKVTLSQQIRLARLRAEGAFDPASEASELAVTKQAIGVVGCSFGELNFWTNTNYTGDTICFSGAGTAALGTYFHSTGSWQTSKKSFYTGIRSGHLTRQFSCSPSTFGFSGNQLYPSQTACNEQAVYLTIY